MYDRTRRGPYGCTGRQGLLDLRRSRDDVRRSPTSGGRRAAALMQGLDLTAVGRNKGP